MKISYTSATVCKVEDAVEQFYSVTLAVECSEDFEVQGKADVLKIENEASCDPLIVLMHKAGCPEYFVSDFTWMNYWKPELIGSMLLLLGIGFGCIGKKIFAVFSGLSVSFFLSLIAMYLIAAYSSWMRSLLGFTLTLLFLCTFCVLSTLCLKRRKYFSVTIIGLGAITGFFIGNLGFVIVYASSGLESFNVAITFSGSFSVFFAMISFLSRRNLDGITRTVSLIGGVLVTRGFSLLIGGYPVDSVQWSLMQHGQPIEINGGLVWGYLAITVVMTLFFFCWLSSYTVEYCDRELVYYLDDVDDDDFKRQVTRYESWSYGDSHIHH